ncbi:MAG: DUF3108 domain-containing protein [Steroidobacter sp.]
MTRKFIPCCCLMLLCAAGTLPAYGDVTDHQYKLTEPDKVMLRPYTARYNVRFHGISGGDIEATLTSLGNGHYRFRSHLLPNLLGRLFTSDQAEDVSEFEITSTGLIRPLHFRSEAGSSSTKDDIALDFDWTNNIVKGRAEDKDISMPVPVGTQDRLTIQLTASLALQAKHEIGTLDMQERNELQQFKISRQGVEQIHNDAGDFNAVVLLSERVGGSSRSSRYWYAPELGYIPVHAERSSHGKVDIVMQLKWVKLGE